MSELPGNADSRSIVVRLYFESQRLYRSSPCYWAPRLPASGWGVLSRGQLNSIAERHYRGQRFYRTDAWNTQGLFDWERRLLERELAGCRRILVAGAGGGREVFALRRLGIDTDGFDSHPELVRFANEMLERKEMAPDIRWAPWDQLPDMEGEYDAVIVGWGMYMHIRRRERRVEFLRELRSVMAAGAPILLSFFVTHEASRYFRWIARIGGPLAWVLRRDPVRVGDSLVPHFSHYFTRERVERELTEAGFELIRFETDEYGHAIGRAP